MEHQWNYFIARRFKRYSQTFRTIAFFEVSGITLWSCIICNYHSQSSLYLRPTQQTVCVKTQCGQLELVWCLCCDSIQTTARKANLENHQTDSCCRLSPLFLFIHSDTNNLKSADEMDVIKKMMQLKRATKAATDKKHGSSELSNEREKTKGNRLSCAQT